MKKATITAFFLLFSLVTLAQLEKGRHFAGLQTTLVPGDIYSTDLNFSTGSSESHYGFNLAPTYGYAVARNWLIGAAATFGITKDSYTGTGKTVFYTYDLGFAPFTRLYLDLSKNGRFKAFGLASLEFATVKTTDDYSGSITRYSYSHTVAAVGVGLGYFARKIALDLSASGVGIRFGVYKTFGGAKK